MDAPSLRQAPALDESAPAADQPAPEFTTSRLLPSHAAAVLDLFTRAGCACHCRYWHFEGSNNDWLLRCASSPEQNAAQLRHAVARSRSDLLGTVALGEQGRVLGWMKLEPALKLPKLYRQRLYRGLPCFTSMARQGVYAIGCFLIDPEFRRRGVATALLQEGIGCARAAGATHLEAFPRCDQQGTDHTLWTGPPSIYVRAGFETVHDFMPYPVLRRTL